MTWRFVDIHSHIQDSRYDVDREEVLARMRERQVAALVVGTDLEMSRKAIALAEKHENLFATIGLHPTDNQKEGFSEKEYRGLALNEKVVAIGECGLDYFRLTPEKSIEEKKRQREIFEKQIELAVLLNLPLMLHCRDAHEDVLDILNTKKKEHGEKLRGNVHFFSAGKDVAKKYLNLDFTLSFTGVITFTRDYDEALIYAPLDMIMSETDCPYVAPVPYRGRRNEPVYVEEVVKKMAEVRGEEFEKVRVAMVENSKRVFKI
ncbi:TatD family hydrolase [bacterium]|nr:TatD family hydrolase [bacterium]